MLDTARLRTCYPVIDTLAPPIREHLLAAARELRAPAGATLFDEHQDCQGFPFVLEGSVRVFKRSPNGRELPLYRIAVGETCIITSACLLGHSAYNACGMTETDSTLMLLPSAVFDECLADTAFRGFIFQLFTKRMADLMQLVEEVAFQRLDQRLAALLLGHGPRVNATHQRLADELGSVREFVSRLLKGFATQGLVRLSREQIEILDPAGLRRVAGENHPSHPNHSM